MPCDAIATARAKLPVALPAQVILKLLQSEFQDLTIRSFEDGSQLTIYTEISANSVAFNLTYDTETGDYRIFAADESVILALTTFLQRTSAFLATRTFAKKGQIVKAQRVQNATILSLRV